MRRSVAEWRATQLAHAQRRIRAWKPSTSSSCPVPARPITSASAVSAWSSSTSRCSIQGWPPSWPPARRTSGRPWWHARCASGSSRSRTPAPRWTSMSCGASSRPWYATPRRSTSASRRRSMRCCARTSPTATVACPHAGDVPRRSRPAAHVHPRALRRGAPRFGHRTHAPPAGQLLRGRRLPAGPAARPTRMGSPLHQFRAEVSKGFERLNERLTAIEAAATRACQRAGPLGRQGC